MSEFRGLVQDALWRILSRPRRTFSPTLRPGLDFEELLGEVGQDNSRARERLFLARSRWTRMMGSELKESLSDDFEVFDLHRLGDGMKGPAYLALTEWLMRRLGRDNRRRLIIFDEAWHLLNDRESAPYLEELFRRARKWNTAVALLSQDIGDFTRNRAAEVCLRNAPMVLLLRQHPESVAEVTQLLRLNEGETAIIESSGMGEGLLILADDHLPLKVIASPREEQLLTAPSQIIHPM
jgi:type IV secretory pathway VirB4 component